jgi:hypothetical protein
VTVVSCTSLTGQFIPALLVFPKNILKQNWWMAHRLVQSTCAVPRCGYRTRFSPSGFFISSNIKSRQKRSCNLGTEWSLFTHTRNLEVITLAREHHVDIICLLPHNSHKMYPWIKLSWSLWKYSTP